MLGLHGIGLSQLKNISVARMKIAFWIAVPAFIALVCPNTLRILSRHEPATSAWVESGPARRCDSQNPHPLGTVAGAGGRSGDHRGCRDTLSWRPKRISLRHCYGAGKRFRIQRWPNLVFLGKPRAPVP